MAAPNEALTTPETTMRIPNSPAFFAATIPHSSSSAVATHKAAFTAACPLAPASPATASTRTTPSAPATMAHSSARACLRRDRSMLHAARRDPVTQHLGVHVGYPVDQ